MPAEALVIDGESSPAARSPSLGPSAEPFACSMDHVLAEMERVDLLIQAHVVRARRLHGETELQGFFISEEEVDELLRHPAGLPRWAMQATTDSPDEPVQQLQRLATDLEARTRASLDRGIELRLARLAERFALDSFEMNVILLCLAIELDLRYERLYGYLQDDVAKKRPGIDLVMNLLSPSFGAKIACRARFDPNAPLLANALISMGDEAGGSKTSLLNRALKLEERVVSHLLGQDEIDPRVGPHITLVTTKRSVQGSLWLDETTARLSALLQVPQREDPATCFYFQGPYGTGKRSVAEVVAGNIGRNLLVIQTDSLLSANPDPASVAQLICREAALQNAAMYWQGFDTWFADDRRTGAARLLEELRKFTDLLFLSGEADWKLGDLSHGPSPVFVEFPRPAYSERLIIWTRLLPESSLTEAEVARLANKFRFTGGQIRDAVALAGNLSLRTTPHDPALNFGHLLEACRLQSNRKLSTLAKRVVPKCTWNDIVLPADRIRQLREVCSAMEFRSLVYDEWGFDAKLSLGKGLSVLFAGPSGTGKTMAAEVMTHALGLELYKIDVSTVVSKYIGETEKNLSRIFDEAATANAVLFFDEADALFGKRSEVRDSHDRYANIEINYLLQKIEQYEGTVVLATNLRKNMDDAFLRRIQFTIEFPCPAFQQRLAIWQKVWPAATPRDDLDLEFMARRFQITGGNIRNVALSAAFLGAEDGGRVTMKHLMRATWQEYQKMGNVMNEQEFKHEKILEKVF